MLGQRPCSAGFPGTVLVVGGGTESESHGTAVSWHAPQAAAQLPLRCPAQALLTPSSPPRLGGVAHALGIKPAFSLAPQPLKASFWPLSPPGTGFPPIPGIHLQPSSSVPLSFPLLEFSSFLCPRKGSLSPPNSCPQGVRAEAASGSGAWGPAFLMLTGVPSLDPGEVYAEKAILREPV